MKRFRSITKNGFVNKSKINYLSLQMDYARTKGGHQFTQYVLFSYGVGEKGKTHLPPNPLDVEQMMDMMKADIKYAERDRHEIDLGMLNDCQYAEMVPLPSQAIKFASPYHMVTRPVNLNKQVDPIRRVTN